MKKKAKGATEKRDEVLISNPVEPKDNRNRKLIVPITDESAYRYLPRLRMGSISGEHFCKNPERRKELGLPPIFVASD